MPAAKKEGYRWARKPGAARPGNNARPYKVPTPLVRVRCLGPGHEHTFWSTDRTNHRVCERCDKLLRAANERYWRHDEIRAEFPTLDGY